MATCSSDAWTGRLKSARQGLNRRGTHIGRTSGGTAARRPSRAVESYLIEQAREPGHAAERIEPRFDLQPDHSNIALLKCALQRIESPLLVSQPAVQDGAPVAGDISALRDLFQFAQHTGCFV